MSVIEERTGSGDKISWTWLSDAGGDFSEETGGVYDGALQRLVTVPDGGGTAPTDDYDVVVEDEDDTDALIGAGIDRDTANTEQALASALGYVKNDKLTLVVSNAGNAKGGVVHLYIR